MGNGNKYLRKEPHAYNQIDRYVENNRLPDHAVPIVIALTSEFCS